MNFKKLLKEKISDCFYFFKNRQSKGCRILMYHTVGENDISDDSMGLSVSNAAFDMQMKWLKENAFHVIDMMSLAEHASQNMPIPKNSVIITFDDGYKNVLTNAFPILKKNGFKATVFVNISFIENKIQDNSYWKKWETLDWQEVKYLHDNGITIGSHGLSHKRLASLKKEEVINEISQSKRIIEDKLKSKIYAFSYPHGSFNKIVKDETKKNGFLCSASSINGVNDANADLFSLRRTEITGLDDSPAKFSKKIEGYYDWLGPVRRFYA